MWLIEFLFGMLLAYLLLSAKLRHLVFHRDQSRDIQSIIEAEEKRESKPLKLTINGQKAEIDESELVKWATKQPEPTKTAKV